MAQPTVLDCRVMDFISPATSGQFKIGTGPWRDGSRYRFLGDIGGHIELMDDSEHTLRTYQTFLDAVGGDVLLCGLGLGCMIRGLLTSGATTSIDVLEVEQDVIDLVGPYFPEVNIVQGDALSYEWPDGKTWDVALFDCFQERSDVFKNAFVQERYASRVADLRYWELP